MPRLLRPSSRLDVILDALASAPTLDAVCQMAQVTRGTLELLVGATAVRHALALRGWPVDPDTGRIGEVRRPDYAALIKAASRAVQQAMNAARTS